MPSQALYLKYRPRTFDQVQGQDHVTRTLQNQLTQGRVAHAYLFTGPRGTGKTSTARILAKAVNCLAPENPKPCNRCAICQAINEERLLDLIEIDAASNTSVEDVRALRDKVDFRPTEARYRVYIIDEAHMLSNAAFNALLKTLEEPPPHVIFILATTEPNKLPATILSRCQRFDFRRATLRELAQQLGQIARSEALDVEPAALDLVARMATGSFRDGTSLLDQLTAYGGETITLGQVQTILGAASSQALFDIAAALAARDTPSGLASISLAVEGGADSRQLARDLVEFFRNILLVQVGREGALMLPPEEVELLKTLALQMSPDSLLRAIRLFSQAAFELRSSTSPTLPLEMAYIESALEPANALTQVHSAGSAVPGLGMQRPAAGSTPAARPAAKSPEKNRAAPAVAPESRSIELPPAAEPAQVAPAAPLTLEALRTHWRDILARMRKYNPQIQALFHGSIPLKIDKDSILVGFEADFHVRQMDGDAKGKALFERVVKDMFGEERHLRCAISPKKQRMKAAESDPLISTALNLGGELTDVLDSGPKE